MHKARCEIQARKQMFRMLDTYSKEKKFNFLWNLIRTSRVFFLWTLCRRRHKEKERVKEVCSPCLLSIWGAFLLLLSQKICHLPLAHSLCCSSPLPRSIGWCHFAELSLTPAAEKILMESPPVARGFQIEKCLLSPFSFIQWSLSCKNGAIQSFIRRFHATIVHTHTYVPWSKYVTHL